MDQETGMCPYCGSEDVDFDGYWYYCHECGMKWRAV